MSMARKVLVFAFMFFCAVPCIRAADSSNKRLLTLDDINSLRNVSDPHISPDGKWVAYTVAHVDVKEDEEDSDIWMTSWDGKHSVQLTYTPDNEYEPRWSPDGRQIVFSKLLLPAPFAPMMPTRSPSTTFTLTSLSAQKSV